MITVKDIREKEFGKQKHGYSEDEVDDFLDEIADQLEMLIRENRTLTQQVDDLRAAEAAYVPPISTPPVIQAQPVFETPPTPAPPAEPGLADEPSYFRNLETTLRETLISAQRIADETTAEARKKAKQTISSAEEQASTILASAKAENETMQTELVELKKSAEEYRSRFTRLVQEQMRVLGEEDTLFS